MERETVLRQGCLLGPDQLKALELIKENASRWAVVISHDCDLPNPLETEVELMFAEPVQALKPELTRAEHPRKLQLVYQNEVGAASFFELSMAQRHMLPKSQFTNLASSVAWSLPTFEKRVLKQWLAARYGRPAFPNSFETRLRRKVKFAKGKPREVHRQIKKIVEAVADDLVGLFFDLGDERDRELATSEPYELGMVLVFDTERHGELANSTAYRVKRELRNLFDQAYPMAEADRIELAECSVVADIHFSLADIRRHDQWRLEYLSQDADRGGPVLKAGGTPI